MSDPDPAQHAAAVLDAVNRHVAPAGIPEAVRQAEATATAAANANALRAQRRYRNIVTVALVVAVLCVEAALWLSPAPLWGQLAIQGAMVALAAVALVWWVGVRP